MGYVDQARRFAEHNLANWRSTGTSRVLVLDPHDYITFTEDYPKYFGADFDIEIVLVVELFADLIRQGRLTPSVPIDRAVTYHDPCRLNKRKGIWAEPREILRAIPGLPFHRRRPGDPVVVLLRRRRRAADRKARADRGDQREPAGQGRRSSTSTPWSAPARGRSGRSAPPVRPTTSTWSTSTSCSPSRWASRSAAPRRRHDAGRRPARAGGDRAGDRAGAGADPHLEDRPLQPGQGAGAVPGAPLGRATARPGRAADLAPSRSRRSCGSPTTCGSRWCRGTAAPGLTDGAVPLRGGIVVDVKRMNQIHELDLVNRTVTVGTGINMLKLNEELARHGLIYPDDPASYPCSLVGGRIGTSGWSLIGARYGHTRDLVLSFDIVLPTGDILHVGDGIGRKITKSSSGYQLKHLFMGHQGTLGIATKATLKLFPEAGGRALAVLVLRQLRRRLRLHRRAGPGRGGHVRRRGAVRRVEGRLPAPRRRGLHPAARRRPGAGLRGDVRLRGRGPRRRQAAVPDRPRARRALPRRRDLRRATGRPGTTGTPPRCTVAPRTAR